MSESTSSLVQYVSTLAGFASSARASGNKAIVAAATLGLAGIVAMSASGCSGPLGPQAVAILKPTCAAVRVLNSACAIVDSTAGGETP